MFALGSCLVRSSKKKVDETILNRQIEHATQIENFRQFLLSTIVAQPSHDLLPRPASPTSPTRRLQTTPVRRSLTGSVEIGFDPESAQIPVWNLFEEGWQEKKPFGEDVSWSELRGVYGETVLNWLWDLTVQDTSSDKMIWVYRELAEEMLEREPALAGVRYDKEPYVGKTLLHQACSEGSTDLVGLLLEDDNIKEHLDINGRMTGKFTQNMYRMPKNLKDLKQACTPTPKDEDWEAGQTPLEIALIAPKNDGDSIKVAQLLIESGAKTTFRDTSSGKVLYTVLHLLARSRWLRSKNAKANRGCHASRERTKEVLNMFMDPSSTLYGTLHPAKRNLNGYTPLQVAAIMGNKNFFVEYLELMKVQTWKWGTKQEVAFPLKEIDTGMKDDDIGALELMVLNKRDNLLSLGLVEAIIVAKWKRFGLPFAARYMIVQIFVMICTAIVCLDDTRGYHAIRWYSRLAVLVVGISFIVANIAVFLICARNEPWFQNMSWNPWSHNKVSIFDNLVVRNQIEMALMCVLVVTPPWYTTTQHSYVFWWHVFAACWWLLVINFALGYFQLFKNTSPLALAMPQIFRHDVVPFSMIFIVMFFCCAISLRVSTTHSSDSEDEVVGSFVKVVMTLEEALHGPDVSWRGIVESHPILAAIIFVGFLWLSLIMMTILVAMFSERYADLTAHTRELFLFKRAMFTITHDKLFPQWYFDWNDFDVGVTLGQQKVIKNVVDQDGGTVVRSAVGGIAFSRQNSPSLEEGEEQPLLAAPMAREDDRWILWKGGTKTFHLWREHHIEEKTSFSL